MASFFPLFFSFFAFLQLLSLIHARNISDSSTTHFSHDLYHSSGNLLKEIKALVGRHPERLTIETMKAQNKGYYADIVVVTYSQSRKDIDDSSKFRILLSFGQHGRELITTELALQLLLAITEEKLIPNVDQSSLNSTLEKVVLKVVPIENWNGRKRVEAGDVCERRNGRGVDLNRNWSVDWGKKEKDYDPHEENPGTAPFSEPETQIMRKLSKSFDPHVWINVHSGMEVTCLHNLFCNTIKIVMRTFSCSDTYQGLAMHELDARTLSVLVSFASVVHSQALFMPYDHKNTTPGGLATQVMKSMLNDVNHLHCKDRCLVGSGGGSVGYLAHGTATDYMYDVMKVPMAFTFEIYGDKAASSKDCFRMFNPVDLTTFNRVINDWCSAFFSIFKASPRWMDVVRSNSSLADLDKLVSIDEYLDGYLIERSSRYGKRMEVLDLGMQEIRTYFRLFLLSSVLLMFMFCSRISKSKYAAIRPIVSAVSL
ncbi:hypothetical protein IFM89_010111 [Coptis chinensis]|uniref:Peptidase M14 domain-containing protein n=1 Tax=Coptis chinensis TaxID=261450 RepID=A0A835HZM5_9MAGN|nr:hypothetical protein IFM89_010111 [Coptis chinensis]